MSRIYSEIRSELEAGRASILATVVMRKGSAPRGLGTKMLVKEDGTLVGTVGGGQLEALAMDMAKEMFQGGQARVLEFDLMNKEAEACGMICGGYVNLYLERLSPPDRELTALIRRLDLITSEGRPALAALELNTDRNWGRRHLVSEEGAESWPLGEWPSALEPLIEKFGQGQAVRPGWLGDYFVEPVLAGPTVYIFGGGHISAHLASLVSLVDFKVTVVDDREEFASPERFPQADQVLCRSFEGAVQSLNINESGYAVIVTRGHAWDGVILGGRAQDPGRLYRHDRLPPQARRHL